MVKKSSEEVTNCDRFIANQICLIRGVQVMLARDLARLYDVVPKQLNWQVQRNIERFPEDFMFRLSKVEAANLKCQIGTSSWGGDRYLPFAFTEQGIAMLSEANCRVPMHQTRYPSTTYTTRDPKGITKVLAEI